MMPQRRTRAGCRDALPANWFHNDIGYVDQPPSAIERNTSTKQGFSGVRMLGSMARVLA